MCAAAVALTGCTSSGHDSTAPTASGSASASSAAGCSTKSAASFHGTALPFDTGAPTGSSSALEVSAGRPRVSDVPSGEPGYRLIQVPIKARVRTNGTFAVDHTQFQLVDSKGHRCQQPSINPLAEGFVALTVDETHTGSGYVAFLVPSSIPPGQLRVRYLPATDAGAASLGWRANAKPATPEKTANSCDGKKADLSTSGSEKASFGHSISHGNDVVSSSVQAGTPHRRAFRPGPTQPNNVDAIDVKLRVSAKGADAYVDRRSFVLVDGSGRTCRSSDVSQGETLTSALVTKGDTKSYTIVFWAPKGSVIHGLQLVQLTKPGGSTAESVWSDPKLTLSAMKP